jgi:spore germination protein GerM
MMAWRRALGVVVLTAALAACGQAGIVDAGAAPTRPPAEPSPSPVPVEPSPHPVAPSAGSTPPAGEAAGDTGDDADGDTGTATPARTTVPVYFARGERVDPVSRVVPRVPRIGTAALEQLLAGPSASEIAAGYTSEIPEGTRLRGLTIADGVAVADFSGEFESGGGTLGLTLRLAQVTCTLDAFPTVDGVRFAVDGEVIDVFSGDGLVVDHPVACGDYTDISGDGEPDDGSPPPVEPS